jgi:hypothetical protein
MNNSEQKDCEPRICPDCGKRGWGECSRAICDNRRPITASVGDGATESLFSSGTYVHKQKYGMGG